MVAGGTVAGTCSFGTANIASGQPSAEVDLSHLTKGEVYKINPTKITTTHSTTVVYILVK